MRILTKDELQRIEQKEIKQLFLTVRRQIKDIEYGNDNSKKTKETLASLQTYYCHVYRELEHRHILKVQ